MQNTLKNKDFLTGALVCAGMVAVAGLFTALWETETWTRESLWMLQADVYYNTAIIAITMYVLLVAFRAERFVRRTNHEEELSLELLQNIGAAIDSIMIDLDMHDVQTQGRDGQELNRHLTSRKLYLAGMEDSNIFMKFITNQNPNLRYLANESMFLAMARAHLVELDRCNHKRLDDLHDLYVKIKSHFIQIRAQIRKRLTLLKNVHDGKEHEQKKYEDAKEGAWKRLELLQEIESDMDKFVRSKQQGTDLFEWIMLGFLGGFSIGFMLLFFPGTNGTPEDMFYAVKLPAILTSGVIVFLFVKLRLLEHDRKSPIMGMTYGYDYQSIVMAAGKKGYSYAANKGTLWPAYFGVIFNDIDKDEYAKNPYLTNFSNPNFAKIPKITEDAKSDDPSLMLAAWGEFIAHAVAQLPNQPERLEIQQQEFQAQQPKLQQELQSQQQEFESQKQEFQSKQQELKSQQPKLQNQLVENFQTAIPDIAKLPKEKQLEAVQGILNSPKEVKQKILQNLPQQEQEKILQLENEVRQLESQLRQMGDKLQQLGNRLRQLESNLRVLPMLIKIDETFIPAFYEILKKQPNYLEGADLQFLYSLHTYCKEISRAEGKKFIVKTLEKMNEIKQKINIEDDEKVNELLKNLTKAA